MRAVAKVVRDQKLKDSSNQMSRDMLFATMSRVMQANDVNLACFLIKQHPLVSQHIYICNGSVHMYKPELFEMLFRDSRRHVLQQLISDEEGSDFGGKHGRGSMGSGSRSAGLHRHLRLWVPIHRS
eukprot:2773540-Karenia_brevis.AAC.1